ncbi:Tyrosine--tRNA ligase, cytoplasmic [Glycine soja]|uniref:Tyrosine--tRNA ligase, cytoplasmic n=1 Tax=Glycine soja TaxID=3848 RepID=A0A0B2SVY4_GLYSO|nr:Tyrosine--tRNA ligase, cytoplasmic [Glycine soja]
MPSTRKGVREPTKAKAKPADKEVIEKENEVSVSFLNIQVGLIRKSWKHPSADSLLVEEDKVRQVISGNRCVVLITNVKPGKLRDVMSQGLVLCASNEGPTIVEPLLLHKDHKLGRYFFFWVSY